MATDASYTQDDITRLHTHPTYVCASRFVYFDRRTTPLGAWYAFERLRYRFMQYPQDKQRELWDALSDSVGITYQVNRILAALPPWKQERLQQLIKEQPWEDKTAIARVGVWLAQERTKHFHKQLRNKHRKGWQR